MKFKVLSRVHLSSPKEKKFEIGDEIDFSEVIGIITNTDGVWTNWYFSATLDPRVEPLQLKDAQLSLFEHVNQMKRLLG